jgi:DNA mismatch repair ATPase MutS
MSIDRMLRLHERETIERLVTLIFEADALLAMADASSQPGFVMPEVRDGSLHVLADGLFHPFVKGAVSNPLRIDQERRLLFLTGPNMAGKTTYLRACGTALYLAHLGMGVPAQSFRFSPCESLFSAITIHDDVRRGVSFFRAEAMRVKAIAQAVADGRRVIALIDEPFKGTNVKDAIDASRAIHERLASADESVFLVSSHLIELGDAMIATGQADLRHFEAGENEGRLQFDYVLRSGISDQRLGVRVLREEGIFDLLDRDPDRRKGRGPGSTNGQPPSSP